MNKEQNHGIQTSKIYWNVQEAQGIQTQKTLGIPIQEMFYYKDTQLHIQHNKRQMGEVMGGELTQLKMMNITRHGKLKSVPDTEQLANQAGSKTQLNRQRD